jgi:hypothetical protein
MTDREKRELEIKEQVFDAVLAGVRTGHMECPTYDLEALSAAAIELLLGPSKAKPSI